MVRYNLSTASEASTVLERSHGYDCKDPLGHLESGYPQGWMAHQTARIEFKANGDDWAVAKGLGAHWDATKKAFYLKSGQTPAAFARWIGKD